MQVISCFYVPFDELNPAPRFEKRLPNCFVGCLWNAARVTRRNPHFPSAFYRWPPASKSDNLLQDTLSTR